MKHGVADCGVGAYAGRASSTLIVRALAVKTRRSELLLTFSLACLRITANTLSVRGSRSAANMRKMWRSASHRSLVGGPRATEPAR
jgi:hypothetical protein